MIQGIVGQKKGQTQRFLEDGTRIPVTEISVEGGNLVIQKKTLDKDGYISLQLGFGTKKNIKKPLSGHIKRAASNAAPRFLREIKLEADEDIAVGEVLKPADVFKSGDIVDVTGVSKGKGFAGVVKRHHFKGGPRTHGQSDRERAPGSIGQTTTPGRVYKGKRMAGRMGGENVTLKNLQVVEVGEDYVLVKGLVPGIKKGLLVVRKVGESKKFIPLYSDKEVVETQNPETDKEFKSAEEKIGEGQEVQGNDQSQDDAAVSPAEDNLEAGKPDTAAEEARQKSPQAEMKAGEEEKDGGK